MKLAGRFWLKLAIWIAILLTIFTVLGVVSPNQGFREVVAHLPVWAGLALVLAAYPAGLAVSREVLPDGPLVWRPVVEVTLAAAGVCVLTLILAGYIGPAVLRSLADSTTAGVMASGTLSLGELRDAIREAVVRAQTHPDGNTIPVWLDVNRLSWDYLRRTDGSALPLLFGWLGILTGFWSRLTPRPDVRQLQHWAIGLFLVMSTYLAGENSYELIVLRAAGPVAFTGDFVLIVPTLLLMGLGWPAVLMFWRRWQESRPA